MFEPIPTWTNYILLNYSDELGNNMTICDFLVIWATISEEHKNPYNILNMRLLK